MLKKNMLISCNARDAGLGMLHSRSWTSFESIAQEEKLHNNSLGWENFFKLS
jgi:hypothetical protein